MLNDNGFVSQNISGVRCFHDYMKRELDSESDYEDLLALEKQYCQTPPFSLLGRYLHIIATPHDICEAMDRD